MIHSIPHTTHHTVPYNSSITRNSFIHPVIYNRCRYNDTVGVKDTCISIPDDVIHLNGEKANSLFRYSPICVLVIYVFFMIYVMVTDDVNKK